MGQSGDGIFKVSFEIRLLSATNHYYEYRCNSSLTLRYLTKVLVVHTWRSAHAHVCLFDPQSKER